LQGPPTQMLQNMQAVLFTIMRIIKKRGNLESLKIYLNVKWLSSFGWK
jgi:hypothetical protein